MQSARPTGRNSGLAFHLKWCSISPTQFEGGQGDDQPIAYSFPNPAPHDYHVSAKKAEEFQSLAQLIEDLIPNLKKEEERKFYREVVQTYRTAAHDILRKAWFDDKAQDIAEYAVMLAVILVLVVGTVRLIGSNANTVFSQAASSIQ